MKWLAVGNSFVPDICHPNNIATYNYTAYSGRNIVISFKTDLTYTYSNADLVGFSKKMSGEGKLDSLFSSSYLNSDLAFGFKPPVGDKMYVNFYPLDYAESYFKKL